MNTGSAIIQAIVALGLAGILVLIVISVVENMLKSSSHTAQKISVREMQQSISTVLNDPTLCTSAMSGVKIPNQGGQFSATGNISIAGYSAGTNIGDNISIQSISLGAPTLAPAAAGSAGYYIAQLLVTLNTSKAIGPVRQPNFGTTYFKIDASGNINYCGGFDLSNSNLESICLSVGGTWTGTDTSSSVFCSRNTTASPSPSPGPTGDCDGTNGSDSGYTLPFSWNGITPGTMLCCSGNTNSGVHSMKNGQTKTINDQNGDGDVKFQCMNGKISTIENICNGKDCACNNTCSGPN